MGQTHTAERHEFSAEVGRLLDLVVHSLYSDREIFLRELVANAADAIDRRRFEALTDPALALPPDAKVRIVPDKAARTLLIEDSGIGMSKADLAANLGTIARSGTRAFQTALDKAEQSQGDDKLNLIGQFGVGFYSAFMVADRVEVTSRRADSEEAWTWASNGDGAFTLESATRAQAGTSVLLHVKADADEYLEPIRLETIVRKWADHITMPIVIAAEGEDKAANEGTALWRKPKAEITEEQYKQFYHHVAHAWDDPWAILHWRAEGQIEFSALLFIPSHRPFEAVDSSRESKVRLHVRRMFIADSAGLLPSWARFVQGVVDTEDLPLNVSREMLQTTPVLARIRKAVTNKVLAELKSRAGDAEEYGKFWTEFGATMKEGVWDDAEHRQEVAALMRFNTSALEGWTTLDEYVGRMKPEQEAIYFLVGDDVATLRQSPQLEGFRARGIEVLLLTDPVDAFWPERLGNWGGKPLRSVTQAAADLSKFAAEAEQAEEPAELGKLIEALKAALAGTVTEIRGTDRLTDSAVVLAAAGYGPDLQMQRILRRHGKPGMSLPPALELNPRHRLIRKLAERVEAGEDVADAAPMLLDLARIQDGDMPLDPAAFARRITAALAG